MDEKLFKKTFDKVSTDNDFLKFNKYWYQQTSETIVALTLQKSKFGNYLDLNIKTFIQGLFNKNHELTNALFRDTGDVFRRQPIEYNYIFNLDESWEVDILEGKLQDFFKKFINSYSENMSSKNAIIQFHEKFPDQVFLLPAVKKELYL